MRYIVIVFDFVSIVILKIFHHVFARYVVKGSKNFEKINGPVIIIINHSSKLDPYTMAASIPFKYLHKVLPFRFATSHKFYDNPLLKPWLVLWGCFPVYPKSGTIPEILRQAVEITKDPNQKSIVIFPEGKICKTTDRPPARLGTSYLAKESNWVILPVGIRGTINITTIKFFTFRTRLRIRFGEPFYYKDVADENDDLRVGAEKMMNKVNELLVEEGDSSN